MFEHTLPRAAALIGWRKSSYSSNDADSCVEVMDGHPTTVPVRDSKNPTGPALLIPAAAWGTFVEAIKRGTGGTV
ncbi:DUF397 domain-containing protein [Streptomyces sp. NPDC046876]|uniref:DUF397 domain-containing protein n=1 Tax=Streptomyces sp. NPDC046876 TaxID=3155616 RepID=UPI003407A408